MNDPITIILMIILGEFVLYFPIERIIRHFHLKEINPYRKYGIIRAGAELEYEMKRLIAVRILIVVSAISLAGYYVFSKYITIGLK